MTSYSVTIELPGDPQPYTVDFTTPQKAAAFVNSIKSTESDSGASVEFYDKNSKISAFQWAEEEDIWKAIHKNANHIDGYLLPSDIAEKLRSMWT